MNLEIDIAERLYHFENPRRTALSKRIPQLKRPIIFTRRLIKNINTLCNPRIKYTMEGSFFQSVTARHQSVLRRKLGSSDPLLQEQKITNLRQAIKKLNGVVIQPGDIFSFWDIIGKPKYSTGYVDGMILSNGRVSGGVGGGLCQLSNFLFWILLHTPTEVIERHHHSMDVFPDSGRVLPFGAGATILYNFVDLQMRNISKHPLQLKLWMTDNHLKGQILSPALIPEKFHITEKNHVFVKRGERYFRYNNIHRETKIHGELIKTEKVTTNFAPVLYEVTAEYLEKNEFTVIDFSEISF